MPHAMLADMHTHSEWSHDSTSPIADMRTAANARGLSVMAVTDHCDVFSFRDYDILAPLLRQREQLLALNEEGKGCRLLSGVEIGEGFWYPEVLRRVEGLLPYDVIIGSVHALRPDGRTSIYSREDFGRFSDEELDAYLALYFEDVLTLISTTDLDILAHLTCPLRYIVTKHGKSVDLAHHEDAIGRILEEVIRRGLALEVNLSSLAATGEPMPPTFLLRRYQEMGGSRVTIGTDAHTPDRVGVGLAETAERLLSLGFTEALYFEGRRGIPYPLYRHP